MIVDELCHQAGRSSFTPIQNCFRQAITFWTREGEFIPGKIPNISGFDCRYLSICHSRCEYFVYQVLYRQVLF